MKKRIIIFTRYPEPGKCKTRISSLIGDKNGAELHRRMTVNAISICREYSSSDNECGIEIRFTGATEKKMSSIFGDGFYREQSEGSLGIKMLDAIKTSFDEGSAHTVVIGSDSPEISSEIIRDSFASLEKNGVVIGPAADGGYYLIGMNMPHDEIFPENMPWGTSSVFDKTVSIFKKNRTGYSILPVLNDIDIAADLPRIWNSRICRGLPDPIISVIVPALNESANIQGTIQSIKSSENAEIIVSDGGSIDNTVMLANTSGARVVQSAKGRGQQQNAGAAISSSNILLFLHADTILPENYLLEILRVLSIPGTVAGAFRLKISGKNKFLRIVQLFTNIRSIFFQLPYGDQALFVKKEIFNKAGFFPEFPVMEDYSFVKKIKKFGRIRISPLPVMTSGRRWDRLGYLKTLLINQLMIAGYKTGVKIEKLDKFYRNAMK